MLSFLTYLSYKRDNIMRATKFAGTLFGKRERDANTEFKEPVSRKLPRPDLSNYPESITIKVYADGDERFFDQIPGVLIGPTEPRRIDVATVNQGAKRRLFEAAIEEEMSFEDIDSSSSEEELIDLAEQISGIDVDGSVAEITSNLHMRGI
jgi:hypothetical protein